MVPKKDMKIIQTFRCETCKKNVTYQRETILSVVTPQSVESNNPKVVYLTCPNGHTHSYTVTED